MPRTNRNHPRRSTASESRYTIFEFDQEFPDDAACLDYLVAQLYPEGIYCPKCERVTKHHRDNKRPSYSCQFCGHHEHPLVGTIFENSATSLKLWFYGIYLMASTRCGISAKQLERELGVTYKTAWRMFNKIRSLLAQDDEMFGGTVEMDEAYIGGQAKWRSPARSKALGIEGSGYTNKTQVTGIAQRGQDGAKGKVHARIADRRRTYGEIAENVEVKVLPGSNVYTDDSPLYGEVEREGVYNHQRVNHSQKIYVSGDVHTNTIEGFWALLKGGIGGVYHSVSTKHLQSYLDEYVFRYNSRDATGRGMFGAFLDRIEKPPTVEWEQGPIWGEQPSPGADQTPSA